MTLDEIIREAQIRLRRGVVAISLDRPTLKILANEAIQHLYPIAYRSDIGFYTRKTTFTPGATITLPANHRETLLVELPSTASGAARRISHQERNVIDGNTYIKGVADDPTYYFKDSTTIVLNPVTGLGASGTIYYTVDYGEILTGTTEITKLGTGTTAVLPWLFEEPLILKIMELARIRHSQMPKLIPSELQIRLAAAAEATKAVEDSMKPLEYYYSHAPKPAGSSA